MKTNAQTLRNFILDFDLEDVGHAVCFTANIEFRAAGVFKKLDTEIQVVSLPVTGLSMLYLLSMAIAAHDIPDTIPFNAKLFSYSKGHYLSIVGGSEHYGIYTLDIYPIENICYPQTLEEIKQKTLN